MSKQPNESLNKQYFNVDYPINVSSMKLTSSCVSPNNFGSKTIHPFKPPFEDGTSCRNFVHICAKLAKMLRQNGSSKLESSNKMFFKFNSKLFFLIFIHQPMIYNLLLTVCVFKEFSPYVKFKLTPSLCDKY